MDEQDIGIPFDSLNLAGTLTLVPGSPALVVFVHGSGSSRFSSRNRYVAKELQEGGLSTLLFDLLSFDEEEIDRLGGSMRFNIELLTERVVAATQWLRTASETHDLKLGYFGASTGAAAALAAAAQTKQVDAIVSRGGRPDLAMDFLPHVTAPTLLIIGSDDATVLQLNRQAFERLQTTKELRLVAGATHLFEEPGALGEVARMAREWFQAHLLRSGRPVAGADRAAAPRQPVAGSGQAAAPGRAGAGGQSLAAAPDQAAAGSPSPAAVPGAEGAGAPAAGDPPSGAGTSPGRERRAA